jgi:peptide deformylase
VGHDESDRSRTAAEIEQVTGGWWRGSGVEKEGGRAVESSVAEHASIGVEGERDRTDSDVDAARVARRFRVLVEVVRHRFGSLPSVGLEIRTFGDPVLKSQAAPVVDVDGRAIRLVEQMFDTLDHSDGGIALAAPQIGVQKQVVVWDLDGDRRAIFNPEIVESSGEWVYDEGCLSIPGLYVELVRPRTVLLRGVDVNGEIIEYEADDLEARMYQHELDHLNGVLMFDRMGDEQRREAMAEYRRITSGEADDTPRPRRLRFS